jgi:calcium-dependent protein kinase
MGCGIMQKKAPRNQRGSVILFPGQFVQNLPDSIYTFYEIKDSLGSGSYGTVVSAIQKSTRELRAIKIINKFKLQSDESRKKVINEVLILRKLDHPHIVKIYEFYEDEFNLYVVMELCKGGELLDTIIKNGYLSEADASVYMKQILSAVFYMHSQGIIHRDLKLENMLLESQSSKNIKIADFGTACEMPQGKKLTQMIGTINYIAPEIFKKSYTEKCDMWSCGVIMYILLTGKLPFSSKTKKQTINLIIKGEFNKVNNEYLSISPPGKELISKFLELNFSKRISAQEAFNCEWVQSSANPEINSNQVQQVINNLTSFGETTKFQRAVIRFIVSQLLSQSERNELSNIFKNFDTSGDGKINEKEFTVYCKKIFGSSLSDEDIKMIMARVDTDKSGFVDYSEFLAAAMDRKKLLSLERLEKAFEAFDKDKNGKISAQELKLMLESTVKLDLEAYKKLIQDVDQNGDDLVDFREFKDMMSGLV